MSFLFPESSSPRTKTQDLLFIVIHDESSSGNCSVKKPVQVSSCVISNILYPNKSILSYKVGMIWIMLGTDKMKMVKINLCSESLKNVSCWTLFQVKYKCLLNWLVLAHKLSWSIFNSLYYIYTLPLASKRITIWQKLSIHCISHQPTADRCHDAQVFGLTEGCMTYMMIVLPHIWCWGRLDRCFFIVIWQITIY